MIGSLARDCIRLYRVTDWLHFLPLPLAGWYWSQNRSWAVIAGGVIAWMLSLAYMSAINQAFDDRLDRLSAGKNPVGHRFSRRQALLFATAPALGIFPVLFTLSPSGLVPGVVVFVAATFYSAPPRVKRVPVLGTLWNVAVGVPGLFFAGAPGAGPGPFLLIVSLFSGLLLVSQLIHEAEDRDDDRSGGVTTIAVLAGTSGALGMAVLLLLGMPALTWVLSRDVSTRALVTVATAIFAGIWIVALVSRIARGDLVGLRRVRLNYRYAALVLGSGVFATIVLT